jgi:YVTN family beta-propeller protein
VGALSVPCPGVDHGDFSANGRTFLMSCEFASQLLEVDVASQRVIRLIPIPKHGQPQDVKLSPDGTIYYVSDLRAAGVWEVDATSLRILGFIPTGRGAHGLYVSRDALYLYVSNRDGGSVSVIDFATRRVSATWRLPGGGSPDMGNVSADGRCCGCRAATTPRCMPSTPRPGSCSRASRSGAGRTGCACGRSLVGTRSATPAFSGEHLSAAR